MSGSPDSRPVVEAMHDGTLRLRRPDGEPEENVKLVLAWPLRYRDRYIVVLDSKSHELLLADSIDDLDSSCHDLVRSELEHRYVESTITKVHALTLVHKVSYWTVETDRGRREFMIEESDTNPQRVTATHWRIVDSSECRYRIPDVAALEAASRKRLKRLMDLSML